MTFSAFDRITCPICGEKYPAGEGHICLDLSGAITSTAVRHGYWTCSVCGQHVPNGELHVCGGSTWPPANPPNATWPPQPKWFMDDWPYDSNVASPDPSLEERQVRALERIADALEKLIHEQKR